MKAVISSTALDLPEHRLQVIEACLRESIMPLAMEQLPARDATGVRVSLEMVDNADIFIGVYGWRYGWVPEGSEISITEMEFNRAAERRQRGEIKEILIFLMHDEHDIKHHDVEADTAAQTKLKKFKERATRGRVRKEFRNADDLRALVIHALADLRRRCEEADSSQRGPSLHPPNNVPQAPDPYIAHPYVLLQTECLIGRQDELNELTDWVTKNELIAKDKHVFSVVAIGGMGKSALTWKWFEDIAPHELPELAGRIWWSFYESDAQWENFVVRALAYTESLPEDTIRQLRSADREDRLLRSLDTRPFLIVLDGFERNLLAYSQMDAAHMSDDDMDEKTANAIASVTGLPADIRETYIEKHRLRQCTDLRTGTFLRKLARVRSSRVLLSTRLYPAELQTPTAEPLPGCHVRFLEGLKDSEALALWRGFIGTERGGGNDELLTLFRAFGNYPLLLRALAGEIAQYRPAPGDFRRWRKDHPNFNPASLPLKNAKTHVLEFALRGLTEEQRRLLHMLAAFRMPIPWDTIRVLAIQGDGPCADEGSLDTALSNLEDRGLLSWEKKSNRYDLHPIVRGVVWATLNPAIQHDVHGYMHAHFSAIPIPSWQLVNSIEELTPAVELFYTLTNLKRFDDAYRVLLDNIESALLKRLSAGHLLIQLLERFFPNGPEAPPTLRSTSRQSAVVNSMALGCDITGEPGKAALFFSRAIKLDEEERHDRDLSVHRTNLALALWPAGKLRQAEKIIRRALREAWLPSSYKMRTYGIILAARGEYIEASSVFRKELSLRGGDREQGSISAHLAQCCLWNGEDSEALTFSESAWTLAHVERRERDLIRAARLRGTAALRSKNPLIAEERLQDALTRARSVNFVQEALPALIALAELRRQNKDYDGARELLEHVWPAAERGPYPLWHADGRNVLAQIERDLGHDESATDAATSAYLLAWCEGPPYAYNYGLVNAQKHLNELGVPPPQLAPVQ